MQTRVDGARGNARLTYAKLYNLGNYENERIEISVETPAEAWGDVVSGLAAACDAFHLRILAERKEIQEEERNRREATRLLQSKAEGLLRARDFVASYTAEANRCLAEAATQAELVRQLESLPGVAALVEDGIVTREDLDDVPF